MKTCTLVLALASSSFIACGDDDPKASDATSATDSSTTPDTSTPTEEDTSVATTDDPDTSVTTEDPDTSIPQKCGCEGGSTCLQATNPDSCASLGGICGTSGLHLVDNCTTDDVMMSCAKSNTTTYYYYARLQDYVANAFDNCASPLPGPAGTFTLTPVAEPAGDVCSCQRTANACSQAVGETACGEVNCTTEVGLQTTPCTETDRVPGRCVTRDGTRELAFYGVSATVAEQSCNGASAAEYYWYPADISF